MKSSTEKATAEMHLQNDGASLLKQALHLLNGKTLSAEQAQNQFDSSLANMGAHIDKTGKDVNRATTSIEGMSAAAVANRGGRREPRRAALLGQGCGRCRTGLPRHGRRERQPHPLVRRRHVEARRDEERDHRSCRGAR